MRIQRIQKYVDFEKRAKNEPIVIYQGSKRSGKTSDILIQKNISFINGNDIKIQCFSESPKQQNFGLIADYQKIFKPILHNYKFNASQKTYSYRGNELAFINIQDNIKANDITNSLGACNIRYINECNGWKIDPVEKLLITNTGQFFFDYNPWREFWIKDLITDTNFLKTTWKDNPFLSKNQIDLFLQWTEMGKKSEIGSYNYWRWQVICEGEFTELTGEIFTPENIHFVKDKPEGLHEFMIFADPSNAKGNDYFALTLTAMGADGNCYLIDSFSCNRIEKVLIAEKIRQWQKDHPVQRTFIETNGEYGVKFYNDCVLAKIEVDGWYSRKDKFERIMANFDVITNKLIVIDIVQNREFIQQVYTFKMDCANDDNIDCLNNAIMAYILVFRKLKILF
jgi:predicted phage terminase large subunit-like protein